MWIINKGSCWRIDNGNTVQVWKDNWIPTHNGFKVITTPTDQTQDIMVHDLMDQDPPRWNSDILGAHLLLIVRR